LDREGLTFFSLVIFEAYLDFSASSVDAEESAMATSWMARLSTTNCRTHDMVSRYSRNSRCFTGMYSRIEKRNSLDFVDSCDTPRPGKSGIKSQHLSVESIAVIGIV
jgi:hypothetical protein